MEPRLRINGKPCNIGLGPFPIVTLAEAREAALVTMALGTLWLPWREDWTATGWAAHRLRGSRSVETRRRRSQGVFAFANLELHPFASSFAFTGSQLLYGQSMGAFLGSKPPQKAPATATAASNHDGLGVSIHEAYGEQKADAG